MGISKQIDMISKGKARPGDNKKWKLKLTLLLVSSLTIMSVITISPALPQMALVFSNVENAEFLVELVLTLPALMIALLSPFTGRLIDRYGRLKTLRLSLVLYALSGAAGYFLDNIYHILISRAVLGWRSACLCL
jgi:MFS family permease